ncbi:MAG: glutamine-hydrolyzing GMP synthase [Actinobacteria bacterium ATB1]|nr:glutamine-hydrolyzing GMP synthase [Actinobacteria bacterium ATB1]
MAEPHTHDTVLVVDFGAQYAKLIARRVREARVKSEIVPADSPPAALSRPDVKALIFSGGPASVNVEGAPTIDPGVYDLGLPILGICYGHQLVARQLGGVVSGSGAGEYGPARLRITAPDAALFGDLPADSDVWMSHFDSVTAVPPGFRATAKSDGSPVAAMESTERRIHTVQFHPEVSHTARGQEILKHFLFHVAGCRSTWTPTSIIEEQVEKVRQAVGPTGKVLCALSGGVDSAVAATLVHKAIGDRLTCVFVDHGLLRKDEAEQVEETFVGNLEIDLVHVKAQDRFQDQLGGVTDPEEKRRIIGETFIRVFEEVARDHQDAKFLVQGTLYPDVIESGPKGAAKIKSHHNVGGLPDDMDVELVEPLRELFKDEVRAVGTELGLPEEIVWRQPFPGPGLAVRIIGEITQERLGILREADAIVRDELHKAGLEREIWQAFAVLPAVRSVGVMGDERTYGYPVVVRAVTSDDAMTADWARLPHDLLARLSSRIINEVPGVNRVVYDISPKPPATIEWE